MSRANPTATRKNDFTIDGTLCGVNSHQEGKTWKAYGSFRDHHLVGSGRTESAALAEWKKRANCLANE